ncbi:MAG: hypothetical protein RLZ98_3376 [Pseudomonadota bacterium]|jgi:hypothetical protein
MSPAGTSTGQAEQRPMLSDEHLALYKFKILSEIKDDILGWAQIRLAILTTVLSFIIVSGSFVGIKLLVEGHIERIAKAPVEQKISVLQAAGEQAKQRVETLRIQSEQVIAMSMTAQQELVKLRGEADMVKRVISETGPKVEQATKNLERMKEGIDLSTQFLHEQALKTKADILHMRNRIELLNSGFQIIDKLAAQIRQKDPESELARQFAGFSGEWRQAREAYELRAADIEVRRGVKIIHYVREDAPQAKQLRSKKLVETLLAAGYTAEGWTAETGMSDIEASVDVGKQFGLDAKILLNPVMIVDPQSSINLADLKAIADRLGFQLPEVKRIRLSPKMKGILAGAPSGTFEESNLVLIAELTDQS